MENVKNQLTNIIVLIAITEKFRIKPKNNSDFVVYQNFI